MVSELRATREGTGIGRPRAPPAGSMFLFQNQRHTIVNGCFKVVQRPLCTVGSKDVQKEDR